LYTDGKTVHYGYDEQIRLSELKEGGRIISYGYDALGRLSEIQKDGEIQTRYGYDAFGNRTWKEESGEQTSYQYNALNQLVSERQGKIRKEYGYDKRGNLTRILENGAWKKQYVYGAMNRLEEAVDAAGKQARYQYNGLGHRVGKQEGVLPKEKLEKLDPQRRVGMEIGNSRQITYTLDLTRQYYNLLERTEESQSQRYFWDGNVAAYEENGERNYYLQDELGSPLRLEDSFGTIKENYEYGVFGEDLYQNQGKMQPFGYTGYQRDEVSGTYYAQAREYLAESGRFAGQDLIAGFLDMPFSMNRYSYCFNTPMLLVDLGGAWPSWNDIRKGINKGINKLVDVTEKFVQSDIGKIITTVGIVAITTSCIVATGGAAATVLVPSAIGAIAGGTSSYLMGGDVLDGICLGAINGSISAGISGVTNMYIGNFLGGMIGNVNAKIFENDIPSISLDEMLKEGLIQSAGGFLIAGKYRAITEYYNIKDKILDVIIDNLEYLGGVATNIFSEGISQRCEE
jgi:RHS repeat-associated protein